MPFVTNILGRIARSALKNVALHLLSTFTTSGYPAI